MVNCKLKRKIFLLFLLLFGCKSEPTLENNIKYSWGEKFVDSLETDRGIYFEYSFDSVLFEFGENKFVLKNGSTVKHPDSAINHLWFDYDHKVYSKLNSDFKNDLSLKIWPYSSMFFKNEKKYMWVLENENLEFYNLIVRGKMRTRVSSKDRD